MKSNHETEENKMSVGGWNEETHRLVSSETIFKTPSAEKGVVLLPHREQWVNQPSQTAGSTSAWFNYSWTFELQGSKSRDTSSEAHANRLILYNMHEGAISVKAKSEFILWLLSSEQQRQTKAECEYWGFLFCSIKSEAIESQNLWSKLLVCWFSPNFNRLTIYHIVLSFVLTLWDTWYVLRHVLRHVWT